MSQVETTSAGVLPRRAPSWMNKSHCKSHRSSCELRLCTSLLARPETAGQSTGQPPYGTRVRGKPTWCFVSVHPWSPEQCTTSQEASNRCILKVWVAPLCRRSGPWAARAVHKRGVGWQHWFFSDITISLRFLQSIKTLFQKPKSLEPYKKSLIFWHISFFCKYFKK